MHLKALCLYYMEKQKMETRNRKWEWKIQLEIKPSHCQYYIWLSTNWVLFTNLVIAIQLSLVAIGMCDGCECWLRRRKPEVQLGYVCELSTSYPIDFDFISNFSFHFLALYVQHVHMHEGQMIYELFYMSDNNMAHNDSSLGSARVIYKKKTNRQEHRNKFFIFCWVRVFKVPGHPYSMWTTDYCSGSVY